VQRQPKRVIGHPLLVAGANRGQSPEGRQKTLRRGTSQAFLRIRRALHGLLKTAQFRFSRYTVR
jgi:hypothetical protein